MANQQTLADILQNLSDEQLQGQMQSPGDVPQYLVLSELQRRKAMRAEAASPPTAPPTTTVADDIMQSGVASTPQMAQGGEDVPDTGIASFAGGGAVGFPYSTYPSGGMTEEGKRKVREAMEKEKRAVESDLARVKNGLSRVKSAIGGYASDRMNDLKGAGKNLYELGTTPVSQLEFKTPVNDLGKMNAGPLQGLADQGAAINDQFSGLKAPIKAAVDYLHPPVMGMDGIGLPTEWSVPPADKAAQATATEANPFEEEAPAAPVGRQGGVRSLQASGARVGIGQAAAPADAAMPRLPAMDELPAPPQFSNFDDHLARVQQEFPDVYADMIAKNETRLADAGKGKQQALGQGLMQMGLGMMASKNPNFLGAMGEGGIGGLRAFADQMHDVRREQMDAQRHAESLKIAQQQARQGNYRTAAELKKAADAPLQTDWEMRYKNVKEKNDVRKDDANFERQLWAEGQRDARAAAREQAMFERMQYSQGQQNARSAASVAARGSGRKAADPTKAENDAYKALNSATDKRIKEFKVPPFTKPEDAARMQAAARAQARADAYNDLSPSQRKLIGQSAAPAAPQAAPKKKINYADIQ